MAVLGAVGLQRKDEACRLDNFGDRLASPQGPLANEQRMKRRVGMLDETRQRVELLPHRRIGARCKPFTRHSKAPLRRYVNRIRRCSIADGFPYYLADSHLPPVGNMASDRVKVSVELRWRRTPDGDQNRPGLFASQETGFSARSVFPLAPEHSSYFSRRLHCGRTSSSSVSQEIEARLASLPGR